MSKYMTKLYIDIDGVLLTKRNISPAEGVEQFIDFITNNFDCYWLTTHCKGNSQSAINYLEKYFQPNILSQLNQIKPTHWITLKTEAIDKSSSFYWLDDSPLNAEIEQLQKVGVSDRLIVVDLSRTGELGNIIYLLKKFL